MSQQEIHEQIRREKEARVLAQSGCECRETQRLETDGAPPRDEPPSSNGETAAFPTSYFAPAIGLTKREFFAAAALHGLCAAASGEVTYEDVALVAGKCADALLKELKGEITE